jgi:hypothetical protein
LIRVGTRTPARFSTGGRFYFDCAGSAFTAEEAEDGVMAAATG